MASGVLITNEMQVSDELKIDWWGHVEAKLKQFFLMISSLKKHQTLSKRLIQNTKVYSKDRKSQQKIKNLTIIKM